MQAILARLSCYHKYLTPFFKQMLDFCFDLCYHPPKIESHIYAVTI
jgi:hypothetical protein